jgi:hypothetical protein
VFVLGLVFTVLFDWIDLITDLLIIAFNVQNGNLNWAAVSAAILLFHLFFSVFSQLRVQARDGKFAFAAVFQLHVAYAAYLGTFKCLSLVSSEIRFLWVDN